MRSLPDDEAAYEHFCGLDQPTPEETEREELRIERQIDEDLDRAAT